MSGDNIQCLGAAFLPYLALVLIVNFDSENRIPVVGTKPLVTCVDFSCPWHSKG